MGQLIFKPLNYIQKLSDTTTKKHQDEKLPIPRGLLNLSLHVFIAWAFQKTLKQYEKIADRYWESRGYRMMAKGH